MYLGGLEGKLDGVAWTLLWLGLLLALVVLFINPIGFVASVGIVINAILIWVVLRALAEIIRLLKHQAGLPYGGRVTSPNERVDGNWECTACGGKLYDPSICDHCGREIVGTEEVGE